MPARPPRPSRPRSPIRPSVELLESRQLLNGSPTTRSPGPLPPPEKGETYSSGEPSSKPAFIVPTDRADAAPAPKGDRPDRPAGAPAVAEQDNNALATRRGPDSG